MRNQGITPSPVPMRLALLVMLALPGNSLAVGAERETGPDAAAAAGAPAATVPAPTVASAASGGRLLPADAVLLATLAPPPAPAVAAAGAIVLQGGGPPPPQLRYYALDALGSVRVTFDAVGNVIGRADYEPFGAAVPASTTGTQPRQQFTGQERDGEVGVDYFGARMYQVAVGRMLSVDPLYNGALKNPQRWNRYAHVLNNPLGYKDPDGRDPIKIRIVENCGGTCFPSNIAAFEMNWINTWASMTGGDYTTEGVERLPSWTLEARQGPTSADYREAYDPRQGTVPDWEPDDPTIESADLDLFDMVTLGASLLPRRLGLAGARMVSKGLGGERTVAGILRELGEEIGEREVYSIGGRNRIADFATSNVLREVKTLAAGRTQYFTRQIRDAVNHALNTERSFELWLAEGVHVSRTLQSAADQGLVVIKRFQP